ncbi:hypothetical protein ST201phi2-1p190 [Pseudomonas phage 201phi2-1]|uniref:Uncharacterized protein n=1 Tax=Pseudomonas phage 201phi2-1 TaxID=198110 RepID=B3FJ53_BP201|nr:hypothetical protein ST201phi2-1p190 [Pseudomonas phage 201phi2-1]ABY63020.1 hypothetical protein 201phi2-1p190 [Pseudomonas phage 201phi2-1]
MLRKLYGRWLANQIEKVLHSGDYNYLRPYMCHAVRKVLPFPVCLLVNAHITRVLASNDTLHGHIAMRFPDFFRWDWAQREPVHRQFWIYMCDALRQGHFDYGKIPNLYDLRLVGADRIDITV